MLDEIKKRLRLYSESASKEDYINLLTKLVTVTAELKEDAQQIHQPRKKQHQPRFSYGTSAGYLSGNPNVTTRSREPVSIDGRPKPEREESQQPSVPKEEPITLRRPPVPGEKPVQSMPKEEPITFRQPPIPEDKPVQPSISREVPITTSRQPSTVYRCSSGPNSSADPPDPEIGRKLRLEIEHSRERFARQDFIVNSGNRLETVEPPETIIFFDRFQDDMLTDSHLMPLLFSFTWPRTTLVVHCAHTEVYTLEGQRKSDTTVRWPLHDGHDRVIIPCCFKGHWTLFDVDLKRDLFQWYDSLGGHPSRELVEAMTRRLTHAEEAYRKPNRNFSNTNCVRLTIPSSSAELKPIGLSTSTERSGLWAFYDT